MRWHVITANDCQGVISRVENEIQSSDVQRLVSDPGVEVPEIVAYVIQALGRKLSLPYGSDDAVVEGLVKAAALAIVGAAFLRNRNVGKEVTFRSGPGWEQVGR